MLFSVVEEVAEHGEPEPYVDIEPLPEHFTDVPPYAAHEAWSIEATSLDDAFAKYWAIYDLIRSASWDGY